MHCAPIKLHSITNDCNEDITEQENVILQHSTR